MSLGVVDTAAGTDWCGRAGREAWLWWMRQPGPIGAAVHTKKRTLYAVCRCGRPDIGIIFFWLFSAKR